ncbi:MAG TPA: Shedu immune nuclease family protein [Pyrinomonadaceae bacterium]|nr:Shedu immune nuclease family protein [Pyrinomonadaceae bacterium]
MEVGSTWQSRKAEHVIRVTDGGRQEIVAKFYEDTRGIFTLTIQRFTTESGEPHKTHFSFIGEEIPRFLAFISNLQLVDLTSPRSINITDADLVRRLLSTEQARSLIIQNQDLILELARSEVTKADMVALGFRRRQLSRFDLLLNDPDYFAQEKRDLDETDEGVWQGFFEQNKWIFGYGLTYLHLSSFDDSRLEQVVVGYDLSGPGKRADAVMKTRGLINALCFVEIKKHTSELLQSRPYRSGCWAPSDELAGGVAQMQGTVAMAVRRLEEKLDVKDKLGDPTGNIVFTHRPRSFLVAGNLGQFVTENGVNNERYRSFELYRRNMNHPEVITFDELYQRAKLIVEHPEN